MKTFTAFISLILTLLLLNPLLAQDEPQKTDVQFIQLNNNQDKLQTSINSYVIRKDMRDITVDLVSAVHIGEAEYYKTLNKKFEGYEKVLYELVAPEGVVPDGEGRSDNPIAMLQQGLKSFLGLESQVAKINYKAKNFVHADLTPQELQAKMAARGDSAMTLTLDAINQVIRQHNLAMARGDTDANMGAEELMDLISNPAKAKQFMAKQFVQGDALNVGGNVGLLIIGDRNQEAIKELEKAMEDQETTKIAIFYGAAHMADFEERLKNLGFAYKSQEWVDAWDLTKGPESDSLMKILEEFLK